MPFTFNWFEKIFSIVFKNPEFRTYCILILVGVLFTTWGLTLVSETGDAGQAFRSAAFTVVSINTTTGFVTDDFNLWPEYFKAFPCCYHDDRRLFWLHKRIIQSHSYHHPAKNHYTGAEKPGVSSRYFPCQSREIKLSTRMTYTNVAALTFMFMGFTALGGILLSAMGVDFTTALSATVASSISI